MNLNAHKPLSSIELAATKENCPALEHLVVFSDYTVADNFAHIEDRISGSVINLGAAAQVTDNGDFTISTTTGMPLTFASGGWVNPGSKTLISISMLGSTNAGILIAGDIPFAAFGTRQGIRTNRNVINVAGNNLADFAATAPVLTSVGAMVGLRFTPDHSINSMEADASQIIVNTPNTTTPAGPIDNLPAEMFITNVSPVPYWGLMQLHCANPPSDAVIAQGMAWLRPHWLAGNFDLLPPMWKDLA